jgi:hypothetical protein
MCSTSHENRIYVQRQSDQNGLYRVGERPQLKSEHHVRRGQKDKSTEWLNWSHTVDTYVYLDVR